MPTPFTPGWFPDRQSRVARESQNEGQRGTPLPLLARLQFYFHKETTLRGAPPAVTGNATASQLAPDATDASSVASGHLASANVAPRSILNKPAAKDASVDVAGGTPPTTVPGGTRVFGWWSDQRYTGTFSSGTWNFQLRDDDNQSSVVGKPFLNVFAAQDRNFSGSFRFLTQIVGSSDWWDGLTTVTPGSVAGVAAQVLAGEYLFFELWCAETTTGSGETLTFHQEGSDLAESARSWVKTPPFGGTAATDPPPGQPSTRLTELPSFAARLAQNVAARTATDFGQWASGIPELIGKDTFEGAAGQSPNSELQQALPPSGKPRPAENQGFIDPSEMWLFGGPPPALPPGQASVGLPPRGASRAGEYSWLQDLIPNLVGQDATLAGKSSVDLPVPPPRRAVTLSDPGANLTLLLPVPLPAGQQSFALPPATAARARDYSLGAGFPLVLNGQDASTAGSWTTLPPRGSARPIVEFSQSSALSLLAPPPVVALPPGRAVTDLPPTSARRAQADAYTQADASEVWLFGTDATATGVQSTALPTPAPRRAASLSEPGVNLTLFLPAAVTPLPPGKQSVDVPPLAARRAQTDTYTQADPSETWLFGTDAMAVGEQLSGNAPAGARRAISLSETGANLLLLLTSLPPVIPPGQSTALTELPPRGAPRARDYTQAAGFPLELLGKDTLFDAPGEVPAYDWSYQPPKPRYQQGTGEPIQDLLGTLLAVIARPAQPNVFDLPPALAAPRRARDYTLASGFPLELIGKDATLVGDQFTDLTPRGPARARDYSWLQGFSLNAVQQFLPGTVHGGDSADATLVGGGSRPGVSLGSSHQGQPAAGASNPGATAGTSPTSKQFQGGTSP